MKVKNLIKILKKVDPETLVVLSCDEEGNRYSKLAPVDGYLNSFDEENNEIGLLSLTEDDEAAGYTEEDVITGKKCIVFWPT